MGNIFENWVGYFYGNVPYNFSTSHDLLRHRLNAGKGDLFYMWDVDATSWSDFMLYQFRIFIYIQPLCAMSFFLALINVGFHAFIEFDENEKHIECVASSTILEGQDDSFGEDDHMALHYFGAVEHRDLERHQQTQHAEWARHHASVFKELAIVELAIFILLGKFDVLAEKQYIDYSGKLSVKEIADMLEERAKRKEMSYEEYEFSYLPSLRSSAEALVQQGTCANLNEAYRYQAHHHIQLGREVPA